MKLRIIFVALCFFTFARLTANVQANDSTSFTDNLKDCTQYYGSQTVELQDLKLTTVREIHGWENGKCSYQETVSAGENKYSVKCMLSKENLEDLVKTMKDFENSVENKNLDLNDYEQVQNSSVVTGWSKYLQNPEICSVEMH